MNLSYIENNPLYVAIDLKIVQKNIKILLFISIFVSLCETHYTNVSRGTLAFKKIIFYFATYLKKKMSYFSIKYVSGYLRILTGRLLPMATTRFYH